MRLTLRDYQEECVQQHYTFFATNPEGHPLFVVPTGGGKSLVIAEFIKRSMEAWPDTRFLVLTHVKELIRQNYDEFCNHVKASPWSSGKNSVGIYSAGMKRRDTDATVLFAGIQSVYNRAEELGHFDLVLIDEAHLVPKKGLGRYRAYLDDLREINPGVRVCGYTATHFRLDGGYLHKGDGRIFTDVAYEVTLETLITAGFLVTLCAKMPEHCIDTSNIGRSMSDFILKDLERAAIADGVVEGAVRELVHYGNMFDRRHWLIFCVGIDHAKAVVAELKGRHGFGDTDVQSVFGHTPKDERDEVVSRFRDGKLTALVNVGVLTTGFNAPCLDLMAVMRPTQSTGLYVQMMGRGMRTHPGKDDCLVLDFGGNVERHGPINRVKPRKQGSGDSPDEEPVPLQKVCPECKSIVLLNAPVCPDCGFEWPKEFMAAAHAKIASYIAPIDMGANKPQLMEVRSVFYRRHHSNKEGKPDSLRVDYSCGMRMISEWVCIEHSGFAGRKASSWWNRHGGHAPIPLTIDDALERLAELNKPETIEVSPDGDYDRVSAVFFKEELDDDEWRD